MKRIKVCFFIGRAYPLFKKIDGVFGGAEIDLYLLALEFAKKGEYDVDFMLGDYGQKDIEEVDGVKLIRCKYLHVEKSNNLYGKIAKRLKFIYLLFKSDADVFFTETGSEFAGYMAIISRLRKKFMVYRTAHDSECNGDLIKESGYDGKMFAKGIKLFDMIIAQNQVQKKMWLENEGRESVVVGNGHKIRSQGVGINHKKHILWVGRCVDWKQPEKFVDIAKQIPEKEFLMILLGENELGDKVRAEAKDMNNLEIIDFVPFTEIQKYYDDASCFVSTSDMEGFPNVFLQSCLGSTPIVSLNVDPDNFILENKLGYIANGDMEGVVGFLRSLDKMQIEELGQNAFAYIKREHDLDDKVRKYDELFKKALKKDE